MREPTCQVRPKKKLLIRLQKHYGSKIDNHLSYNNVVELAAIQVLEPYKEIKIKKTKSGIKIL